MHYQIPMLNARRLSSSSRFCFARHESSCKTLTVLKQHKTRSAKRLKLSRHAIANAVSSTDASQQTAVLSEHQVPGMSSFLDSLKYNKDGHVAVIVQHVDTGELLMQAFADRAALNETLQTRLATFYSRSRGGRWCKGETSGHFIKVLRVFLDCDKDSIVYLGDPIGPACHTGAPSCWFTEAAIRSSEDAAAPAVEVVQKPPETQATVPLSTLYMLEATIQARRQEMENQQPGAKPSWTAKLLTKPELLASKVREEAGELCQAMEENEGQERVASEMADLLYHSMVLLNTQGVSMEQVLKKLRGRFGTSGIDEKAARPPNNGA